MSRKRFTMRTAMLVIAIAITAVAIGCTNYPQNGVEDIEGVQSVNELFDKYRILESESPDRLAILLDRSEPETFQGLITKPIKDSKIQMHLRTEWWVVGDTYAECILHNQEQVFEAKVGDNITVAGRLSEFSENQIKFTQCRIEENHTG